MLADRNLINVKHFKWRCLPSEYGKASTVHGKFMKWIRDGRIQVLFDAMRKEYLLKSDAFKNWYAVDTSYSKAPMQNIVGKTLRIEVSVALKKTLLLIHVVLC